MRTGFLTLLFLTIALPSLWAQISGTTQTLIGGDIDNGFLIAPDFKFTDVNGDFANLAGAYGGWVINKKLLIGGGVYTLTNGGDSSDMTYGGAVFEYFVNQDSLVNVSFRGLVGGGNASFGHTFPPGLDFGRGLDFGFGRAPGHGPGSFTRFPGGVDIDEILGQVGGRVDIDEILERLDGHFDLDSFDREFSSSTSFFVAEPEVNVNVNISERLRFSVGGSYRFIGGAGRLNTRLDGFAATAALKIMF